MQRLNSMIGSLGWSAIIYISLFAIICIQTAYADDVAGSAVAAKSAGSQAGESAEKAARKSEGDRVAKSGRAVRKSRLPIYRPPSVGKPAHSVGGGTRGPGDGSPALYVLVPNHVAQTASSQPSLFWFVDNAPGAQARMEFTLLDEDGIEPLVQARLETPEAAGIYRIRLSEYGVELKQGIEYEWSVAMVLDPEKSGKDIVSTGWIDRVGRADGLDEQLSSAGGKQAVNVLAQEGLWYDALTTLGDQLEKRPTDAGLTDARAALLQQVGLAEVATATPL
jgi:hypothetical protein